MKKLLFVGLVLAIFIFAISTFLNFDKSDKTKIVVGVSPFQDTILPLYAQKKGFLESEKYEFEFRVIGWTEVLEGLSNQTGTGLDVGVNNICSVVGAWPNNSSLVYYYPLNPFDDGFALMARNDGKIRPLDFFLESDSSRMEAVKKTGLQLKGKTIVTTSNTDMEQGVAAAVKRAKLDFNEDVTIINLPPDEGLLAFLAGTGDFYIGGIPQRFKAKQEGMIEILTGVDLGPAPINGLVTSRQLMEKDPDALSELINGWFDTVKYIDANLESSALEIVTLVNSNTAGELKPEDFYTAWNELESFMKAPDQVSNEILSPSGKNYWLARWNDCNDYFVDIAKTSPTRVEASKAAYVTQAHELLIE